MKKLCCLTIFVLTGALCFAQISRTDAAAGTGFFGVADKLDYSPSFNAFRPVPLADESGTAAENPEDITIFDNSPQWAKDLRRGEIVFFGSLPFTVFFSRFFIDLVRMGMHSWDRRYAPWPFKAAGGVAMTNADLIQMFSVAGAVSLSIAVVDHLIVRHRRKAAAEVYDSGITDNIVIEEDTEDDVIEHDIIEDENIENDSTENENIENSIIENDSAPETFPDAAE